MAESEAELILRESAEVMADVKSFHFDVTGQLELESSDSRINIPITYEGDSVAPDRTKARLTLSVTVFVLQMDIIMIGEEAWTTNAQTGVWQAAPTASIGLPNPVLLMSGGDPALDDAKIVKEETIDGASTVRLEGTARLGGLTGAGDAPTTAEVWIGADDRLVYRIRYSGTIDLDALGLDLAGVGLAGDAVLALDMALSQFDAPVEIERPIPE